MRIAAFNINGKQRLGLITGAPEESIIDLTAASEALKRRGETPLEVPRDMLALIGTFPDLRDRLSDLANRANDD